MAKDEAVVHAVAQGATRGRIIVRRSSSTPDHAFRTYSARRGGARSRRRATAPRVEVPMRARLALVCALMPLRTAGTQRWTQSGCECQLPFAYRSIVFHTCTELEWTGHPW